jgi:hypothetical protein
MEDEYREDIAEDHARYNQQDATYNEQTLRTPGWHCRVLNQRIGAIRHKTPLFTIKRHRLRRYHKCNAGRETTGVGVRLIAKNYI